MKRKSACLILMVMVYCMCQLSVFASENTGVLLLTPEEAQAKYEMLLEQGVIKEYTPTIMPASTIVDRNRYLVYSVGVKQSNGYYCGPAAVLQALYASSDAGNVSGTTNTAKQKTLASSSYLRTDIDQATSIYNMPATLKALTGKTWSMMHVNNSNPSYNIYKSHEAGNAVIYLIDTIHLSYYDYSCIHYVTGTGIYFDTYTYANINEIDVRLQDPHYDNSYYGEHTVSMSELIDALSEISYSNVVYCY